MARKRLRPGAVIGALAITLSLSACGSTGLMHDGSTAGSYDGITVTNDQVSSAVADINKVSPQANFDAQSAIAFMTLAPQLQALAGKYGVAVSEAQARAQFPATQTPSQAAVDTVRSSMIFGGLQQSEAGSKALGQLISTAKVSMNPRYGVWKVGEGPTAAPAPWIKSTPSATATPAQ